MDKECAILFVDDEEIALRAVARLFREEPYQIILAGSGKEALELIEEGARPAVVVSDQMMPEMTGLELFKVLSRRLPDCPRVLLTAFADVAIAIEAINQGGIFRYLRKPWDDDELKHTVRMAVVHRDLILKNHALSARLVQKNALLEELNSGLEARVEERTRELQQAYKENLKLTEQLQRQVTQLEGRDQLQKHILTIHPLDETLQVVLRTITQYNALDAAIFYLVQGAKVSPKAVAGIGLSEPGQFAQKSELISLDSRIGKISAIGQAMDEKVPVQSG
ncbi:MAG: response regulator, partial [Candidatus Latescibacteria bacterium]|nr:response regulator [Candidatus Latescibacterota bacterium]